MAENGSSSRDERGRPWSAGQSRVTLQPKSLDFTLMMQPHGGTNPRSSEQQSQPEREEKLPEQTPEPHSRTIW
ncbi:hypothetical protein [Zoogloea oleivorans]|uniref:hypothetical protein n=1 Tax=Zoogloea oleivorans TaxID=1552750 RepID=UPI0016527674|nr:hypothetical protein [Zoogloea oleivorans]